MIVEFNFEEAAILSLLSRHVPFKEEKAMITDAVCKAITFMLPFAEIPHC